MSSCMFYLRLTLISGFTFSLLAGGGRYTTAQSKGPQQPNANPTTARLSGHVYRADTGEPLSKVTVSLSPQDEKTADAAGERTARTGPDGTFVFSQLPAGTYALEATRNGFVSKYGWDGSARNAPLVLGSGQEVKNLTIHLTLGGVISGMVLDEDNEPVPDISVFAIRPSYSPGGGWRYGLRFGGRTDDLGRFRLTGLLPGPYYLRTGGPWASRVLKQGPGRGLRYQETYYPGTLSMQEAQPITVTGGAEVPDVRWPARFENTYTVNGMVSYAAKNADLKPTGVEIDSGEVIFGEGMMHADVRADGSFTIQGLAPGEYRLTATALQPRKSGEVEQVNQGYAIARIADADVDVNLKIGRACEVRGQVVYDDPQAATFAGLQISLDTRSGIIFGASLDAEGKFDIRSAPPGRYTFSLFHERANEAKIYLKHVECSGKDYATQPLMLGLGATLNCKAIVATDTATISGQVKQGDRPAVEAVVVVVPEERALRSLPRYTLSGKTGSDGHFRIAALIPGDYLIFAVPPDEYQSYFALDFAERNAGSAQTVSIKPGESKETNLQLLVAQ